MIRTLLWLAHSLTLTDTVPSSTMPPTDLHFHLCFDKNQRVCDSTGGAKLTPPTLKPRIASSNSHQSPETRAYPPLIATCDPSILRTCKTISTEATPLLLRNTILDLDLDLGYLSTQSSIHLNNDLRASIQRLELRISMNFGKGGPPNCVFSHRIIARFGTRSIMEKSCIITIDSGVDGCWPNRSPLLK